jgi:hypothetical protein
VDTSSHLHWSLHAITYPLLFTYFLPVLVIWFVAADTQFFLSDPNSYLQIAQAIAGPFFDTVRTTMGAIFVPFVMAYALKDRKVGDPTPLGTLVLYWVFLGMFILGVVLYGIVEWRAVTLQRNNFTVAGVQTNIYEVFKATAIAYGRESLTYLALVLGITLRPAATSAMTKEQKS